MIECLVDMKVSLYDKALVRRNKAEFHHSKAFPPDCKMCLVLVDTVYCTNTMYLPVDIADFGLQ